MLDLCLKTLFQKLKVKSKVDGRLGHSDDQYNSINFNVSYQYVNIF